MVAGASVVIRAVVAFLAAVLWRPTATPRRKGQAADSAGVACEGCRSPGSKANEILEDVKENKRPYKFGELPAVGIHKADVRSCTACHNARDPGRDAEAAGTILKLR
jgi:hypothetical protein